MIAFVENEDFCFSYAIYPIAKYPWSITDKILIESVYKHTLSSCLVENEFLMNTWKQIGNIEDERKISSTTIQTSIFSVSSMGTYFESERSTSKTIFSYLVIEGTYFS